MFAESPLTSAVLGVLLGTALLCAGAALALNWQGWTDRYTKWVGGLLTAARYSGTVERRPLRPLQNRIIFGVVAIFGAVLLIGGLAALIS